MFYEILGAYIDLSKVTKVWDELEIKQYGCYKVWLEFEGVDQPIARDTNGYIQSEVLAGRQAYAQLQAALDSRHGAATREPRPYTHDDLAFDLCDVRLIEHVYRDVKTSYSSRNRRQASVDVTHRYAIVLAGQPVIQRSQKNAADTNSTPLHHEHDKLVKNWIWSMERVAA